MQIIENFIIRIDYFSFIIIHIIGITYALILVFVVILC